MINCCKCRKDFLALHKRTIISTVSGTFCSLINIDVFDTGLLSFRRCFPFNSARLGIARNA